MPGFVNKLMSETLKREFSNVDNLLLIKMEALDSEETFLLRKEFNKRKLKIRVVPNRITKRVFKEIGKEGLEEYFTGPTAVVYGEEPITIAKTVKEFAKKTDKIEIKGGYLFEAPCSVEEVNKIASIPSKEVLYAQVVGGIASPLTTFLGILNGVVLALVNVLNQIKEKKENNS